MLGIISKARYPGDDSLEIGANEAMDERLYGVVKSES